MAGALAAVANGVQALPHQESSPPPPPPSLLSRASANSSSTACNNSPTLCDRNYNDITYMGAHDSAFLRDAATGESLAGDQYENATVALDAGLRFLQAQVHDSNGTLHLCHTTCELLDAGTLVSWLASLNDWMDGNPDDVVTLLLVNSDSNDVSDFGEAFQSSGISQYGYTQPSAEATGSWPTLRSMISSRKRLVSFITDIDASSTYPYLLSEFNYIFETAYQVTSLDGFNCTLNRPSNEASAAAALSTNYMGLVNHFKYQDIGTDIFLPDTTTIDTVNSAGTTEAGELGTHLQSCRTQWGLRPNFVLVDFWSVGNTIQAADNQNGLKDITGRTNATAANGSDNGESMGTSLSRDGKSLAQAALLAFLVGSIMLV